MMRLWKKRKWHRSEGQAIVEFSLIVPIFLFLTLALLDVGRAYYANQIVLIAAREGARVGILPERSEADVERTVRSVMNRFGFSNETLNYSNVGADVPSGATTRVRVELPFQTLTGTFIPGWEGSFPLTQTFRMRHE